MQFLYHTERLLLEVLGEEAAPYVLAFYQANQTVFQRWEPFHDEAFYTLKYQKMNLAAEMKLFLMQKGVRYYLFEQQQPEQIIGTISFTHIIGSPEYSCRIGYRISKNYQRKGYAKEALTLLLPKVTKELNIMRIEANIMPSNLPSIHLIECLGFKYEGVARKSFEINGVREDHLRYALVL